MQYRQDISRLRKQLIDLYRGSPEDLGPFLSDRPLVKGNVYPLRRKCSKPTCRCARGEYHETIVLTARIGGKARLWTIPEDRLEAIREGTERYRTFRQARADLKAAWTKRQREIFRVIDAIANVRMREP